MGSKLVVRTKSNQMSASGSLAAGPLLAHVALGGAYVNPNSPAARSFFGPGPAGDGGGLPWIDPTPTRVVRIQCGFLGWSCR